MRALLKKELTEVLVPFGAAFVVIVIFWLGSVRFWDALLPPASEMLQVTALTSALAGAVLGYLQFSAERWRGKLAYLFHRGTGFDGAFLAKAIAGFLGTALLGFGPPLAYAVSASLSSPNAPILDWTLLGAYASVATAGASLYGLGALAATLRRRAIAGILAIPLGGAALWLISEMCGTPWGSTSAPWRFPALHLALAVALLVLAARLMRSGTDADLPLPRRAHLALVALAVPLVLFPCDLAASILGFSFLSGARSDYPMLARDRQSGEIFPVVSGGSGGHFRMRPGGSPGEEVELGVPPEAERGADALFWGNTLFGASATPTQAERRLSLRSRTWLARRGMMPIFRPTGSKSDDPLVETAYRSNVRAFLDWERGTVRAFRLARGSRTPTASDDLPFEIELGKPGGDRTFSRDTLELQGAWSCLLDPEDGSFWRVDVLDPSVPLARVELPERDRFVRMEPMYRRDSLAFGRYQEAWEDPAVVGEHGRYTWNGREFVAFDSSGAYVPASEAENLLRFRVVIDDPDPIRCTVRVLDAKDDGELFAYSYAPQTALSHAAATAAQATVFLRSPLANTLISTGVLRRDSESDPTYMVRSEFLAGGRRPWLWLLDLGAALLCAGVCARLLRRREVAPIWIGLGSLFVLLFGPVALLVVWLLEPKGRARAVPSAAPVHEPALVIQSASP